MKITLSNEITKIIDKYLLKVKGDIIKDIVELVDKQLNNKRTMVDITSDLFDKQINYTLDDLVNINFNSESQYEGEVLGDEKKKSQKSQNSNQPNQNKKLVEEQEQE